MSSYLKINQNPHFIFILAKKTEEIIIRSSDLSFISNENTVEKLIQNHSVLASLTDNLVNFLVKWKRLYVRTGRFTIWNNKLQLTRQINEKNMKFHTFGASLFLFSQCHLFFVQFFSLATTTSTTKTITLKLLIKSV